jgi:hypothetical protein
MKLFNRDEFGWNIGKWNTPISARWIKSKILRCYGIQFNKKFNVLCFGRLEIRVWKPVFLRPGNGIYFYKTMPYDKSRSM